MFLLARAVACALLCASIPSALLFAQSDLLGSNNGSTPARGSVSVGLQYLLEDGMTPPSVKPSSPSIEYPEPALLMGMEGSVAVKLLVDEAGSVAQVNVVSSSDSIFTRQAVEGVRKFRFVPAAIEGKPTELWLRMDIGFTTEQSWSTAFRDNGTDDSQEGWAVIADNEQPQMDQAAFRRNLVYPQDALDRGARGIVVVRAKISTEGEVVAMEIDGVADAVLAEAAINAVAETPFTPGSEGGKAKEMWTMIPVNFTTSNGEDLSHAQDGGDPAAQGGVTKPEYDINELYGNFRLSAPLTEPVDVKLRVLVDETGSVKQVLVSDEQNAIVSKAAVEAVKATGFTPGTQNGEAIPVWMTVDMRVSPR